MLKKKINILPIVYIVLVYFELATALQHVFPVTWYSKYFIGIIITILMFAIFAYKNKNRIPLEKRMRFLSFQLVIPMLLAYLYSVILTFFRPVNFDGYQSRSFGLLAYCILAIIQAYFTYSVFGKPALKYTFYAVLASYGTSIIVAFVEGGFTPFIRMIADSSYHGSVLEMHEVAPIAGLFIFFLWYDYKFGLGKKKYTLWGIVGCIVILLFSLKRIVILSTILSVLLFYLMIYVYKRMELTRFITIISILFIGFSLTFVYLIKSKLILAFISRFNINSMARDLLWFGPDREYYFSLFYPGKGLGFLSKWMDANWTSLGINGLNQSTGIHSDILKYYIDLGFVGYIVFFGYYLIHITKKIRKKIGYSSCILYFIVMMMQFLIYFTDNVSLYHNYQWVTYLMIFYLTSDSKSLHNRLGVSEYAKQNL